MRNHNCWLIAHLSFFRSRHWMLIACWNTKCTSDRPSVKAMQIKIDLLFNSIINDAKKSIENKCVCRWKRSLIPRDSEPFDKNNRERSIWNTCLCQCLLQILSHSAQITFLFFSIYWEEIRIDSWKISTGKWLRCAKWFNRAHVFYDLSIYHCNHPRPLGLPSSEWKNGSAWHYKCAFFEDQKCPTAVPLHN